MSYDLHLQVSGPTPPEKASALIAAASSLGGDPTLMWEPPFGLDPEDSRESLQEMIDDGEISESPIVDLHSMRRVEVGDLTPKRMLEQSLVARRADTVLSGVLRR